MSKSDAGMGGIYNHVNFNLYHYAGNNPINYTDPDGRDFNRPNIHHKQNGKENRSLPMGSTPSGKYEVDDEGNKTITKRNTIGSFGCLFTEVYNNAMGEVKDYCNQHNIPFHDPGIRTYSKKDDYFNYYDHANDPINPRNETDANMDKEKIKKLYEAASGRKVKHVTSVTQKDLIPSFLKLIKSSKNKITVIGRCMGHFFTIRNINADGTFTDENGDLAIEFLHDPQINIGTDFYTKYYEDFYTKLKTEGPDKLFLLD